MGVKQELKAALKKRISEDVPEQFFEEGWDEIALTAYYFATDQLASLVKVRRVLKETADPVLADFGLTLSQGAEEDFYGNIQASDTPKSSVDKLVDAASVE